MEGAGGQITSCSPLPMTKDLPCTMYLTISVPSGSGGGCARGADGEALWPKKLWDVGVGALAEGGGRARGGRARVRRC